MPWTAMAPPPAVVIAPIATAHEGRRRTTVLSIKPTPTTINDMPIVKGATCFDTWTPT